MTKTAGGRPAFLPTATDSEVVGALLACGVPLDTCRLHITNPATGKPVSYNTFCRAFNREIATAVTIQNANVADNLLRIATANSSGSATVEACKFWLRVRAGWRCADGGAPERPQAGEGVVETEEAARKFIDEAIARYGRQSHNRGRP